MGFNNTPDAFNDAQPYGVGLSGDAPRILLVVGGGIAAYKACELVRLMRRSGVGVTCVVTAGGQQFVTPMALAALSENMVYTSLFDLKDESEMGHIQLSRQADLVVVCPATADLLAKMAAGIADDLATTLILATDKPVIAVPAMNVRMWQHEATQRNVRWLAEAGVEVLDPDEGAMACGEFGPGRLPEPAAIWSVLAARLGLEVDWPGVPAVPEQPVWATSAGNGAMPQTESEAEYTLDDLAAEALEPEPEPEDEERPQRSTLTNLLSAIIPRSTPRRQAVAYDDDAALPELGEEADEWADAVPPQDFSDEAPAEPDLSSPLLARKGKASAAPPTDPAALNHLVNTGAGPAMPEPVEGWQEFAPRHPSDPLAGQAEFDPDPDHRPLYGRHVLVTAGPTWEPIDPVRYLANRSSGRQGFAIAAMAASAGARVTLVAGPVALPTPLGVDRIDVESAEEMAAAVKKALPADIAFMVAAVADWRPKTVEPRKMKKRGSAPPALMLTENPDILATVAASRDRPPLLIGFAAETEEVLKNARTKRKRKGADWIVANDVSTDVMGGLRNTVHIISSEEVESFDEMPKEDVARELVRRAAQVLNEGGEYVHDD
ncbi:phosphopantothenate--cysteine ligase family flavoprotein [Porphyrobacter sp. GA68]|uniref:bifunctional phosphopantothenoylcysteine decarboxylase/phosphopantothenate synthase n=1 Tax=Porphyrobacter sp. GA68 TaxID=2883480 RepID=UPI001D1977AD|nr:bifunctional phosphopantothenoylcysteine decarboxylase/phosphopantothenate synthase [Porphyrobacter sp. GA68]